MVVLVAGCNVLMGAILATVYNVAALFKIIATLSITPLVSILLAL